MQIEKTESLLSSKQEEYERAVSEHKHINLLRELRDEIVELRRALINMYDAFDD